MTPGYESATVAKTTKTRDVAIGAAVKRRYSAVVPFQCPQTNPSRNALAMAPLRELTCSLP